MKRNAGEARGFSLVEISIALGVAAFCLLAIVGLLQTGLASEQATVGKTAAWGILSSVSADLLATSPTNAVSAAYGISFSNSSAPQTVFFTKNGVPTGSLGDAPTPESYFRASVGLQPPGATSTAPTLARLLVTWPAAVDPLPGTWPSKASGSVEVITALRRN
jgi:uncharacterized protein (TIGR02598 family)